MSDSSDVLCHLDSGIRLHVAFIIDFILKRHIYQVVNI